MFQTELIHYLQSFETDWLTKIFFIFTTLGFKEFFLAFVIIFMFGINFKKGMVLTHVIIVTGLITEMLKHFFSLPRPYHVDSNIKMLGKNIQNDSPFTNGGADSFFGLPASDVIDYYRNKTNTLFGLPSGHTSTSVTIWGSLFLLYKEYWIKTVCLILIIMIPLSRLYLGRHFLGDVLGGYIVGAVILLIFYLLYYKNRFRRFRSRSIKYSS
jgi:membrane-associated phospholipid phosphatase